MSGPYIGAVISQNAAHDCAVEICIRQKTNLHDL